MNETERMKELVKKLNEAAKAYYQEDREIMSNLEYDTLYDELQVLEEKTGVTLAGSPTTKVGYEAMDELPKEAHESPMLSLDKTKDVEVRRSCIGDHKTLLSWKMDGLTVVLTYRGGTLAKAVTRGNGVIGEVVTNNAKVFENIPLKIPYQGELVLRGEAIIRYSDFAQTPTQILFNHSQWHFCPKIFFFIRFTCVLFLPILLNLNQKMYFIRNDFNLRRTCHFNIFPITLLSIDNHTPCKQNKS